MTKDTIESVNKYCVTLLLARSDKKKNKGMAIFSNLFHDLLWIHLNNLICFIIIWFWYAKVSGFFFFLLETGDFIKTKDSQNIHS